MLARQQEYGFRYACLCQEVWAETEDLTVAWELLQEGASAAPRLGELVAG